LKQAASQHLYYLDALKTLLKPFSQVSLCPGRDINPGSPTNETGMTTQ